MNDLRILENGFQQYSIENKGYPAPVWAPGTVPAGMSDYIHGNIWTQPAAAGGSYTWKKNTTATGVTRYYISLVGGVDEEVWDAIDKKLDDGISSSGRLQSGGSGTDHAYFLDV